VVSASKQIPMDIADYCNWLGGRALYLLQMIPGTAADTLSETEETVPRDEGTCGKSSEGTKGNPNFLFAHLFI
jgi:hypothetical protein